MYSVKEIFYTLQGEGANAGRAAVFCRFTGCNLWSGREIHRQRAVCQFCDTDFIGTDGINGGRFDGPVPLADAIERQWPNSTRNNRFVVFTGGEPLLQLDGSLVAEVRQRGFTVAIETNGTKPIPEFVDWVCVSPKAGAPLVVHRGDEIKFVYPQRGFDPAEVCDLAFDNFYIQPMDGPNCSENCKLSIEYCLAHPKWRLSLQMHKVLGIG